MLFILFKWIVGVLMICVVIATLLIIAALVVISLYRRQQLALMQKKIRDKIEENGQKLEH